VTVTVTDDDGAATSDTLTVTVLNVAPTVNAGADQTVDEGSVITLDPATFNDLGTLDTHTAKIDWGDGIVESGTVSEAPSGPPGSTEGMNGTVSGSHVYADNGVYTVTVTVTDDEGGADSDTLTLTVNNVAPMIDAGVVQSVDEGSVVSLAPATFNDLGTLDTHTATINWGDGTATEAGVVTESPFGPPGSTAGADGTISGSHVYADEGTFTVTVTVMDDEGDSDTKTFQVTVNNVAPTLDAGADQTVDEGTVVSLSPATFNDLGTLDTHTATISWGDATATEAGVVTETPFGPPGSTAGADGEIAGSHVYADNGVYTVTVTVTDDDGAMTSDTLTVTVLNIAPTLNAGADQTVAEGTFITLDPATFSDPGFDNAAGGTSEDFTATINWGDGTMEPAVDITLIEVSGSEGVLTTGTIQAQHAYADDGIYTVTLTVTDDDGGTTSYTLTVTVNNVAPTVDAGPDPEVDEGAFITLAPATFTDPGFDNALGGTSEDFTATIDWGDGTTEPAADITLVEIPGSEGALTAGTIDARHTYADDGTYTVTVTVTDDDGATTSDTLTVRVNNVAPTLDAGAPSTIWARWIPTPPQSTGVMEHPSIRAWSVNHPLDLRDRQQELTAPFPAAMCMRIMVFTR